MPTDYAYLCMRISFACVIVVGWLGLQGGMARAATPATCSMDDATYTLTVTLDGVPATLAASSADGVTLDGNFCVDPVWVDTINVVGSPLDDKVTFAGRFIPGYSYEPDFDEIEINLDLGGGTDTAIVKLTATHDVASLLTEGLMSNGDPDLDLVMTGIEIVKIFGLAGNDYIGAANYAGSGAVYLHGGPDDDTLEGSWYGSGAGSYLYGDAGDDAIQGSTGDDVIVDGSGTDYADGSSGNDRFEQGAIADFHDVLVGGDGVDTVDYGDRTYNVAVFLESSPPNDDGEAGERDDIIDIENAIGGSGNDILTGGKTLIGGAGDDDLSAHPTGSILKGGPGADTLHGHVGFDQLYGNAGNDVIYVGLSGSSVFGGAGDDIIHNLNGFYDFVQCGPGIDDAEDDWLDNLTACEL